MKNIESLTPAQIAKLPEYIEKWTRIGLCTDPADRKKTEEGIIESYKTAGLEPPHIVWCSSPLAMGFTRAILLKLAEEKKLGDIAGASVWDSMRASVWDSKRASVVDSVWDSMRASMGASVRDSVWDSMRGSVWDSMGDSMRASVRDSVWASVGASVWDSVWASVGDSVWDSMRGSVWDSVGDSGYGQHDANWIGFYDYFRNELGLTEQTSKLLGLQKITENAGWFLPHKGICWVSERTCVVVQDNNKRMHCENGPAIKYPDGWALHYWHGVKIPGWIVETPEQITVNKIESESNAEIRRVMMTKYGIAKYLEESGAKEINRDRDTKGERILYRKEDKMGAVQIIKLENSTPEKDGSKKFYTFRVPPDLSTCQEAVAYLYSREPSKYRPNLES